MSDENETPANDPTQESNSAPSDATSPFSETHAELNAPVEMTSAELVSETPVSEPVANEPEPQTLDEVIEPASELEPPFEEEEEEVVPIPIPATETPTPDITPAPAPAAPADKKKWYIIKVPSGREDSTRRNLERKIKLNNVEEYFGRLIIPVEKQVEVKDGKKKIKNIKKLPGYLFAELEFNENVFLTLRETYGVGGFLDGGNLNRPPLPMPELEVQRTLADQDEYSPNGAEKGAKSADTGDLPKMKVKLDISPGDRVKIKEGMFANMEGEVKEILDKDGPSPKFKVELSIWGRPVDVDLDHWQADKV